MSLLSFSTSERNDAEIPVASATRASESRRALRVARRRAPSVAASVVPSGVVVASDPDSGRPSAALPLDTITRAQYTGRRASILHGRPERSARLALWDRRPPGNRSWSSEQASPACRSRCTWPPTAPPAGARPLRRRCRRLAACSREGCASSGARAATCRLGARVARVVPRARRPTLASHRFDACGYVFVAHSAERLEVLRAG